MLASYFYAQDSKLDREDLVTSFLKLMVSRTNDDLDGEGYDEEANIEEALKGMSQVIRALFPARDKKTKELTDPLSGPDAEKAYRAAWVIAYVGTLKRKGFPVPNPLDGATGEMNPKDEKQVHAFIEDGNSPDFNDPVANGEITMPRWLINKAASVMGEIDGDRTADFYRYAREHEAKKNAEETRDPETKGDPA